MFEGASPAVEHPARLVDTPHGHLEAALRHHVPLAGDPEEEPHALEEEVGQLQEASALPGIVPGDDEHLGHVEGVIPTRCVSVNRADFGHLPV